MAKPVRLYCLYCGRSTIVKIHSIKQAKNKMFVKGTCCICKNSVNGYV